MYLNRFIIAIAIFCTPRLWALPPLVQWELKTFYATLFAQDKELAAAEKAQTLGTILPPPFAKQWLKLSTDTGIKANPCPADAKAELGPVSEQSGLGNLHCGLIKIEEARVLTDVEVAMVLALVPPLAQRTDDHEGMLMMLAADQVNRQAYPQALQIILELISRRPEHRLAYEIVQRIFTQKQTGSGQVALGK